MTQITNLLYWLSTGLLVPVTLFLLFYFLRSLFLVGGLYGKYLKRAKLNAKINQQIENTPVEEILANLPAEQTRQNALMTQLHRIKRTQDNEAMLNKILGDHEIIAEQETGKSKLLVKIGPMLGLMGTLIPMGPALVGLATGDISSMASNMQVAFATTVVGIIIGAIGFITLQLQQRWVADDLNILEYIVESLNAARHEKEA